ncbi:MAG: Mut7-C RNAse domain-containing protein [Balneolaceae bacterium]|jgi:uncharacterized protein with PIN domain
MKKSTAQKATLIAKGSLGDFLTHPGNSLTMSFELNPSVKDLVEAHGIPHTAIFRLTANDKAISLDYNVQPGDIISAYPIEWVQVTEDIDPIYLQPSCFVADVHLGKLAKTLRLLGFDTYFDPSWNDHHIIEWSNKEHRMILTRDLDLLKNGHTQFGYWVRNQDPEQQINELLQRFKIKEKAKPFSRCVKCNGLLSEVSLSEVENKVPPKVKLWQSRFFQCADCRQVYWRGAHYEKLHDKVKAIIGDYDSFDKTDRAD